MEKFYYIVDSEKPADDSIASELLTEEEALEFLAENQVDLAEPQLLGDGTEITKKYYMFEAPEVAQIETEETEETE
jgi:hypothetical protein